MTQALPWSWEFFDTVTKTEKLKRSLLTIGLTVLCTAIIILGLFELQAQRNQLQSDAREVIDSEILGEERQLLVHLPRGYAEDTTTYPLLLVLDGSSKDFTLAQVSDILTTAGAMPPVITVSIPNTDRNRDLTPPFCAQETGGEIAGGGDDFLAFIVEEALPVLHARYRTDGKQMLAGHSRAGLFTLYAQLERPDIFTAYFCFSPAFWRDDHAIIAEAKNAWSKVDSLSTFLYLSLGTEENDKMRKGYQAITKLLDQTLVPGLSVVHEDTPGANHQSNTYLSAPSALGAWGHYLRNKELKE
ncbi:MAG: alpha/beta hydrolase [Lewinella sp.]